MSISNSLIQKQKLWEISSSEPKPYFFQAANVKNRMEYLRELILEAGPEAAARALDFVADACREWKIDEDALFDIQLAVDEAISNIVEHGYAETGGPITLRVKRDGLDVIIELVDRGKFFDPSTVPAPEFSDAAKDRQAGGLGVFFMYQKMDVISYRREEENNVLTMVKKNVLPGNPSDALDILLEASQALARTDLDEPAILEILQSQVRCFLPSVRIHILLFHDEQAQLFAWDESGRTLPPAWYDSPAAHSIMGWLKETRKGLLVRDFDSEWERLPAYPSYENPSPPSSAIFAPMVVANQALGAISVQSRRPNAFTQEHLTLLRILANQAAAALSAVRLLTTERRRANQLQTLARVTRSVVSILDMDKLFSHVVDIIAEAFNYYHVQIFELDPNSNRLIFKASSDRTTHELWRRKGRYELLGKGIIGWVAAHGHLRNVPDVTKDPFYIPDDPRLLPDTRSEIAVALKLEDEVLGVLDVQSDRNNAFGEEDEFILIALADAVALSIANARLYASAIEQERLATELQVARDIQIGFLPDRLPDFRGYEFAARWEPAREIGGDFYDFIPLQNDRLGLVIADVADKGIPAALYMALSRTTMRLVAARDPSPAVALHRVNTAILDTTYSDLFVTMFYMILDQRSHLVRFASGGHGLALLARKDALVPLRGKGMALGILSDIHIEERWQGVSPGDYIILYTDGVTDAVNERMEAYGRERFYERIRALWGCDPEKMATGILDDVRSWKGKAPRYDDFTLVIAKRTG